MPYYGPGRKGITLGGINQYGGGGANLGGVTSGGGISGSGRTPQQQAPRLGGVQQQPQQRLPTQQQPQQQPYGGGGGGAAEQSASQMAKFGSGLLDPGSDLSRRYMEQLSEDIGGQTDAAERAAAYRAAQGGFGAGASPEMLSMQQDIGVAGQEAYGDAASNFMMQAPGMGLQALGGAMGGQTQMRGQDLQSRLAEQANILSREQSNAGLQMQQRGLDLNYDQLSNDRYLRELALMYSGMGF